VDVQLIVIALKTSIFLAVLALGMRATPADLRYLLSNPSRLVRSLVAMNILVPIITVIVCRIFSLHPAVIVGLVTLSVAPVGALFSQSMLPLVTPGGGSYAHGLFFASTVLSIILTPLAAEFIRVIIGGDVHVNPLVIAQVVAGSVLVPLGVGLAVGRWWPAARQWAGGIQKVSFLMLLASFMVILALTWSYMGSVIRQGTLAAIAILALIGIAVGHFLGGPQEDDRTVLAFATVSRHPGVAIAIANLTDQPLAPVGVLLAFIVSQIAAVPYKRWRRRLRTAGPAAAGREPTGAH
jgi:BASS family bile acid:Na+ symporter